ncbi:MoaD/ThiS family protein [Cellvibrio polysaccharolyticus]|uniref:Molybdopterin synthase sulfur carrier subunit n=1 Tax=Cellvibrio polysaccharolyticus TaxID=2082724 RepID=A0A928V7K4_9GAMM|nr:MoaD/ThiS family protein [Cellvibrio polysaccharolyticus]MBE8718595.1 MoaD/ThiS family protein [Cellvibrio polysaccharolyticus]
MIKILFFASLRETLGCAELQLPAAEKNATVATLLQGLLQQYPQWQEVLTAPNILISRNREMAKTGTLIQAGDEIAFFPPVTGG